MPLGSPVTIRSRFVTDDEVSGDVGGLLPSRIGSTIRASGAATCVWKHGMLQPLNWLAFCAFLHAGRKSGIMQKMAYR